MPIVPTRPDRCETCDYFYANSDPAGKDKNVGTCRRFPPAPSATLGGGGRWPRVHGVYGWCGEHPLSQLERSRWWRAEQHVDHRNAGDDRPHQRPDGTGRREAHRGHEQREDPEEDHHREQGIERTPKE